MLATLEATAGRKAAVQGKAVAAPAAFSALCSRPISRKRFTPFKGIRRSVAAGAASEPSDEPVQPAPAEGAKAVVDLSDVKRGDEFDGKVVSIETYGAFVDFGAGSDGLVHISQLADGFVKNVGDSVQLGETVKVRVLSVDAATGRVALSMKGVGKPLDELQKYNPPEEDVEGLDIEAEDTNLPEEDDFEGPPEYTGARDASAIEFFKGYLDAEVTDPTPAFRNEDVAGDEGNLDELVDEGAEEEETDGEEIPEPVDLAAILPSNYYAQLQAVETGAPIPALGKTELGALADVEIPAEISAFVADMADEAEDDAADVADDDEEELDELDNDALLDALVDEAVGDEYEDDEEGAIEGPDGVVGVPFEEDDDEPAVAELGDAADGEEADDDSLVAVEDEGVEGAIAADEEDEYGEVDEEEVSDEQLKQVEEVLAAETAALPEVGEDELDDALGEDGEDQEAEVSEGELIEYLQGRVEESDIKVRLLDFPQIDGQEGYQDFRDPEDKSIIFHMEEGFDLENADPEIGEDEEDWKLRMYGKIVDGKVTGVFDYGVVVDLEVEGRKFQGCLPYHCLKAPAAKAVQIWADEDEAVGADGVPRAKLEELGYDVSESEIELDEYLDVGVIRKPATYYAVGDAVTAFVTKVVDDQKVFLTHYSENELLWDGQPIVDPLDPIDEEDDDDELDLLGDEDEGEDEGEAEAAEAEEAEKEEDDGVVEGMSMDDVLEEQSQLLNDLERELAVLTEDSLGGEGGSSALVDDELDADEAVVDYMKAAWAEGDEGNFMAMADKDGGMEDDDFSAPEDPSQLALNAMAGEQPVAGGFLTTKDGKIYPANAFPSRPTSAAEADKALLRFNNLVDEDDDGYNAPLFGVISEDISLPTSVLKRYKQPIPISKKDGATPYEDGAMADEEDEDEEEDYELSEEELEAKAAERAARSAVATYDLKEGALEPGYVRNEAGEAVFDEEAMDMEMAQLNPDNLTEEELDAFVEMLLGRETSPVGKNSGLPAGRVPFIMAASVTTGFSAAVVKQLREKTGAGMMDCKKALAETSGDMDAASEWLRKKGLAGADKKAGRVASEGAIVSYIHPGSRLGVLLEVNCETDFVAAGDKFQELVGELGMICAASPDVVCVSADDVPAEILERERSVQMAMEDIKAKPEAVRAKIVEGRLDKIKRTFALMEQESLRDATKRVTDIVKETIAAVGENIQIRRFVKYNLGEGLEKRSNDFAAEVEAQTQAKKEAPKEAPKKEEPKKPAVQVSAAVVKQLRDKTGAGMMDCKKALAETSGDAEAASEWLRKKGLAGADKKAGRVAAEGAVVSYIHPGSRLGVLLEVNCETDFVAASDKFQELVSNVAMQIAASPSVQYVSATDIPAEVFEREKAIEMQREDIKSKPEAIRAKIAEGRAAKIGMEMALLDQPFLVDPSKTVGEAVKEAVASIGEKISVRRFVKFSLGEGIEKKTSDLAEEVAKATGQA